MVLGNRDSGALYGAKHLGEMRKGYNQTYSPLIVARAARKPWLCLMRTRCERETWRVQLPPRANKAIAHNKGGNVTKLTVGDGVRFWIRLVIAQVILSVLALLAQAQDRENLFVSLTYAQAIVSVFGLVFFAGRSWRCWNSNLTRRGNRV